jgi:hypothetical protein
VCMISTLGILLLLLGLGGFVVFKRFSRTVVRKPSQDRQKRLARIGEASFLFQLAIGICFLLSVYSVLAFLFGWPFFSEPVSKIVVSPGHVYASPSEMPRDILALALVKAGLNLAAMAMLYALFRLYGRGILFSARNVLYIRFQGYYLILTFLVDYQIQSSFHDMALSTTPVFVGLLIIFIAWIMDEGRKIQEEQALTV